MAVLKVENLTKVYGSGDTEVTALDHVSFQAKKENLSPSSALPVPENPR